ncbi:MAG TPA: hypothetical protein PLM56_02340 [Cyclobacteriaceae bacterium]|jgi:hypothetical protein|nr:hypothetical protein [Cytophagales bacterium]HMR58086.1 hypothetical protein [Cyclobacteriaceae bacterium]HNT51502.1 hypothetical protein [Cyclobacteriaceae bacterium]HRE67078.1 hypothetical protein [Cyclobacteriaceae bacterium]HRF32311.1 hypothetical protein [Cyclobacteriaceae bacterium]
MSKRNGFRPLQILLLCLLATACTAPQLILRDPAPERLRVTLSFTDEVPEQMQVVLQRQFDDYVILHNSRTGTAGSFKLESVQTGDQPDMIIRVRASKLVTSGQQTAGVIVSMIGFTLPIAMAASGAEFVLFFWYFPQTQSLIEISLNPQLSAGQFNTINYHLGSPGFLKSPQGQMTKHGVYFHDFLKRYFKKMKKR